MNTSDSDDDEGSVAKPDWKKKKVGDDERLTLRIDAIEADKYQARKNKMTTSVKRAKPGKISKKVRQLHDEEDEEEDGLDEDVIRSFHELRLNQSDASNSDTTLIDALSPSERRMIEQRTNIEVMRKEENAGKLNALEQADTLARKAGIEKMTTDEYLKPMQEAIYNPRRIRTQALEKNITKQTDIQGEIKPRSEKKVVEGVKEIREMTDNHKVKNIKMDDAKAVSRKVMTQNETAEMILRKSGQTAKLSEIRKQSVYSMRPKDLTAQPQEAKKDFEADVKKQEPKNNKENKSYNEQLKSLLKETLQKNNKVRG